jgi:hypothetical protein
MQWFLWLVAIILSIAAGYWVYRADVKRSVPRPWLTALLRGLVVLCTLLLLLAPAIVINKNETRKPLVVLLQDESRSIGKALGKDTSAYKKNIEALQEKLGDDYKVVARGFGDHAQGDSLFSYKQQATDIATALADATEFYGNQNIGAVVLATDGRFNQGANPIYQQLALNAPLYTVGIGDTATQKDLIVTRASANKTVSLNSRFEIRAEIVASLCNGYSDNVRVFENGSLVAASQLSISSDRYSKAISFNITADKPGLRHYTIVAAPANGEVNAANNKRDVFVEVVEDKKNILLLAAAPHPDINAIKEALSGMESYKLTVKTGGEMLSSFSEYAVVILHQLPSNAISLPTALTSSKKPTWYILGSQTNPNGLNMVQKAVSVNMSPMLRNVFAGYNSSFSAFTLPQNIQAVLDKMPPLSVPNGTFQPSAQATVLFENKNKQEQLPLWLLQQGEVPNAVLMGEGLWRWRIYEYKNFNTHATVDECIRQTIAFLAANTKERPFTTELPKYIWSDQEAVTLNAYLLNANNEQVNTPDAQLVITDSAGRKQNFSFERSGNSYRINIGIWQGGTYNYTASASYNGKNYTSAGSFVVESVPLELMESGADYPLLYALANKYNGSFVPAAKVGSLYDSIKQNNSIKPVIQTNTEAVPLVDWKWFFFLILLLAVAEWLLRKYWMAQ